ncbi:MULTISPECIES: hypothetical protein [Acinetobacter]|uniref:hypothetical protein n=1 Tax=Acinetobacter TaxID=469 RepID=UPI000538C8B2|nr:hypothetical protein [Acinetobacter sp. HR7]KGT48849.1 hypothetical protein GW12_00980 [Acinetobacter sp. HR7]
MNQRSLVWGIGITVAWLVVIFLFWFFGDLKSPTSLNELGDFLAGIIAPIAFFGLILGYVQQGRQLEQNTKALEQQEKALQLQIDEMRESVKQQKTLIAEQKKYYRALEEAVRPILVVRNPKIRLKTHLIDASDAHIEYKDAPLMQFSLFNDGKDKAIFIEIYGGIINKQFIQRLNRINDFTSQWIATYLTDEEISYLYEIKSADY